MSVIIVLPFKYRRSIEVKIPVHASFIEVWYVPFVVVVLVTLVRMTVADARHTYLEVLRRGAQQVPLVAVRLQYYTRRYSIYVQPTLKITKQGFTYIKQRYKGFVHINIINSFLQTAGLLNRDGLMGCSKDRVCFLSEAAQQNCPIMQKQLKR